MGCVQLSVITTGRRTYYTFCSPMSQAKSNVTFNLRKGTETTSHPPSHTIYKFLDGIYLPCLMPLGTPPN